MSIDEQYAATVQCYSQLLREDRYTISILLTFTLAVMWSFKSSPTSGSVCNTFGCAGDPQIVLTGSSSDEVGVVRVDHPSYLMTLQLKIRFGVFQVVCPCLINGDCCINCKLYVLVTLQGKADINGKHMKIIELFQFNKCRQP